MAEDYPKFEGGKIGGYFCLEELRDRGKKPKWHLRTEEAGDKANTLAREDRSEAQQLAWCRSVQ